MGWPGLTWALLALLSALAALASANQWKVWWTYEGFSGPDFWGLVNSEWKMCARGLQQSPVNIDPGRLLFDPNMGPLRVDAAAAQARLLNTGQQLLLRLNQTAGPALNVSGGPLGPYAFRLHHATLHFPRHSPQGSEHTIDGERFPAELQLLGFNRDLYANFSEAQTKPQGLVGLAVMVDVVDTARSPDNSNAQLRKLTAALRRVRYKDDSTELKSLDVHRLLPDTSHYVTYEGSLTYPGCYETVTWVVLNKPIYLRKEHLKIWQNSLEKGREGEGKAGGLMGDNFRPLKDLNTRLLRTNINFRTRGGGSCPTMYKDMYYKANPWRQPEPRNGFSLQRDSPPAPHRSPQSPAVPSAEDAFHAPFSFHNAASLH